MSDKVSLSEVKQLLTVAVQRADLAAIPALDFIAVRLGIDLNDSINSRIKTESSYIKNMEVQ